MVSATAVSSDGLWFRRNPKAVLRFRPVRPGEFVQLERCGEAPPSFVPAPLRGNAPLSWVVVVDLTRCLMEEFEDPSLSLRVRLLTVPLRSKAMQRTWTPVYLKAVLSDLLYQMELWSEVDECLAA